MTSPVSGHPEDKRFGSLEGYGTIILAVFILTNEATYLWYMFHSEPLRGKVPQEERAKLVYENVRAFQHQLIHPRSDLRKVDKLHADVFEPTEPSLDITEEEVIAGLELGFAPPLIPVHQDVDEILDEVIGGGVEVLFGELTLLLDDCLLGGVFNHR